MSNNNRITCRVCGRRVNAYNARYDDRNLTYICDQCYNEMQMSVCNHCGAIVEDVGTVHTGYWAMEAWCDECIREYTYRCDECGELFSGSCEHSDEYGDICQECYDSYNCQELELHDHSYKPEPRFLALRTDCEYGRVPLYLGVELEIDKGDSPPRAAYAIQGVTDAVYLKHDGSLDNGIEIVTHPATLSYHLLSLPWNEMCAAAREYNFLSHGAGTCGLHVHVNRDFFGCDEGAQDLHIAKIIILVERYWDEMVLFSRRRPEQLAHWAKKPCAEILDDDDEDTAAAKAVGTKYDRAGRYQAVNLKNDNTVEFRFFRGTLRVETILATLRFVSDLCHLCKNRTLREIQQTTWNDLVRSPAVAEYWQERLDHVHGLEI